MKRFANGKLMAALLAIALTLAVSPAAFAAWPSFQNDSTNNGIIATATPITTPTMSAVVLPDTNGAWLGVDAAPVIKDGKAYVVYDAGTYDPVTGKGGARLAIVNLSTKSATSVLLDSKANNVAQLSTPCVKTIDGSDIVFAGTSYETEVSDISSFTGWTATGGAGISGGTATFSGAGTISGEVETSAANGTLSVQTNLNLGTASGATYGITLTNSTGTYTLVPAGTAIYGGGYGTDYTYNGENIPAGTYTAVISVTPTGGTVTGSTFYLGGYGWQLNVVTGLNTQNPQSSVAQYHRFNQLMSLPTRYATGAGQLNTPIGFDADYIYFGVWGGTHNYYQYKYITATSEYNALNYFSPTVSGTASGEDDFYLAGAYSDGTDVYFGSDNGIIYKRQVSKFYTPTIGKDSGTSIDLTITRADAGEVRSTIAFDGTDLFFTSKGTGSNGYIWRLDKALTTPVYANLGPSSPPASATSTPVISSNGYVYAGYNASFTSGGVWAFPKAFTSSTQGGTIYSGAPVQASPIVYSPNTTLDYVYFTTNSSAGAGYGFQLNTSTKIATQRWTISNTSGNKYSSQGMASDGGKVVWGDDGNNIYIVP